MRSRSLSGRGRRVALVVSVILLSSVSAHAATVIVRPSNLGIWRTAVYDSGTGKTYVTGTTSNGTHGEFTAGPGTPPIGLGSFHQHVGSTGIDGQRVETQRYSSKKLTFLSQLSYWTYVANNSSSLATSMVLLADIDGNGLMTTNVDDVLTFEPKNQTGVVPLPAGVTAPNQCGSHPGCVAIGTWQSWNAKVGAWSVVKYQSTAAATFDTLESYQSAHPLALLAADIPSLRLSVGFDGIPWVGFDGNFNAVRINDATFDFENPPAPPIIQGPMEAATVYKSPATISGVVEGETGDPLANSTVTVKEGTTTLASTVSSGSGAWSVTVPLADGPHTVSATASTGSYTSPASVRSFFVQFSPTILTPAPGATVHSTVSMITGTAGPGQTVNVYESSTLLGSAITLSGCTAPCPWSVGPAVFAEGPHTVSATATEGSETSPPSVRTFTVDIKPAVTSPIAGYIKTTTPIVGGTAGEGMTIKIYEGMTLLGTTATLSTCEYPCSWSIGSATFPEGQHTITATATEGSFTSAPVALSFTVDITPPGQPAIVVPSESAVLNTTSIVVSGTADPGVQVDFYEGTTAKGVAIADASGAWQTTATFSVGIHTIKAVATDLAGNTSIPSALRTFKIEFSAPVAPVILSPGVGAYKRSPVTVSGTGPNGTTISIFEGPSLIGKAPVTDGVWSISLVLAGGRHSQFAKAVDAYGHSSLPSSTVSFTVDAIAPSISFSQFGAYAFVGAPLLELLGPGGSAGDDFGIDHVIVTYNSVFLSAPPLTHVSTCSGCPARFISWSDAPPLSPGIYRVTAIAYDRAGNASPPVRSFLVQLGP